ncbi:hypothetical protein S58_54520 [Bradyrhizobium oligotrophicum S58]|uniref:Uncharacterized protein n=1 Tax=Bradyrhizobium oligotrophicum S58 TaxID=1245469 RepID=M4ZY99_9BRAD|nr:hypothetical protein [Bradyrhizobium oligotrophicum]BAM91430.1 hypothetical protein S58_54520 [Bradyrhizobium oligotrophicum S58]
MWMLHCRSHSPPPPPTGARNIGRRRCLYGCEVKLEETNMDGLIYLVGLIVVVMAILSFFGLR